MFHIRITAPVTARARRIIAKNRADVSRVVGDKSARIVTLPSWYQPEAARETEQEIYDAQAGRYRRHRMPDHPSHDDGYAIKVRATVWGKFDAYLCHVDEDGEVSVYDDVAKHYSTSATMSPQTAARIRRMWMA